MSDLEATAGEVTTDAALPDGIDGLHPAARLLALASHYYRPGGVSEMRKKAVRLGLDPNKWFNNVEIVTAGRSGTETTIYVRNIYKYCVAYKLKLDAHYAAAKATQQVKISSLKARQNDGSGRNS